MLDHYKSYALVYTPDLLQYQLQLTNSRSHTRTVVKEFCKGNESTTQVNVETGNSTPCHAQTP